jgi:hypothetical protein
VIPPLFLYNVTALHGARWATPEGKEVYDREIAQRLA